jgi:hypothetical protein
VEQNEEPKVTMAGMWDHIKGLPESVQGIYVAHFVKTMLIRDPDSTLLKKFKKAVAYMSTLFGVFLLGTGVVGLVWCIVTMLFSIKGMF